MQTFIKKNQGYILLAVVIAGIPIAVNYGLLTWRMPGLQGDAGLWMEFLGSYLGIITAILIAFLQVRKQQRLDRQNYIIANRSYLDIGLLNANMYLIGGNIHEDARIIRTTEYERLEKTVKEDQHERTRVIYFYFKHLGVPEIIYNCSIKIEVLFRVDDQEIKQNMGYAGLTLPKNVEVFIPLVPPRDGNKRFEVELRDFSIKYQTISGETLLYSREIGEPYEILFSVQGGKKTVVMKCLTTLTNTIFPNKFNKAKRK